MEGVSKNLPNFPTGNSPTHLGPHANYDNKIIGHIDDVLAANGIYDASIFDFTKLSEGQVKSMLDRIEALSMQTLINWKPVHLN